MIEIVAELSSNHNGSLDTALKTIEAAHKSGATMIKAQAYTPDYIAAKGYKIKKGLWKGWDYHDLYKKCMTPYSWFPKLKSVTESLGMEFFASAFDYRSVDMLEKLGVKRHKVASYEITDIPLIRYMASKNKPLIISTGIATNKDIDLIESMISADITWLVCTSSYPTKPEDTGIARMFYFNKPGLSDHTKGNTLVILSVAYDPVLIEKHFILDSKLKTPDASFSSTPSEFKLMVDNIRRAEKMNTFKYPKVDKSFARSLWVVKDVKKGEKFTKENIRSLRPNLGLHPMYLDLALKKLSICDLKAPCPLRLSYF